MLVIGPYGTNHSVVFRTVRLPQNASRYECDLARRKNLRLPLSALSLSRSLTPHECATKTH